MDTVYYSGVNYDNIKKVVEHILEIKLERLKNGSKQKVLSLLTRQDTAKTLRVSLPTLSQWTKEGIIKAHRIGNRVLYKVEDVNDALKVVHTSAKKGGKSC